MSENAWLKSAMLHNSSNGYYILKRSIQKRFKFPTGAEIKWYYCIRLYMKLVLKGYISNVNDESISDY